MPDDDAPLIGWKSFKFLFGAEEYLVEESEAKEIERNKDRAHSHDKCGCGCYLATCDCDGLDQQ